MRDAERPGVYGHSFPLPPEPYHIPLAAACRRLGRWKMIGGRSRPCTRRTPAGASYWAPDRLSCVRLWCWH